MVFLFGDQHVMEEGFLELVNNMLTSGMVPALFADDEKEGIVGQVSTACSGRAAGPQQQIGGSFVSLSVYLSYEELLRIFADTLETHSLIARVFFHPFLPACFPISEFFLSLSVSLSICLSKSLSVSLCLSLSLSLFSLSFLPLPRP